MHTNINATNLNTCVIELTNAHDASSGVKISVDFTSKEKTITLLSIRRYISLFSSVSKFPVWVSIISRR